MKLIKLHGNNTREIGEVYRYGSKGAGQIAQQFVEYLRGVTKCYPKQHYVPSSSSPSTLRHTQNLRTFFLTPCRVTKNIPDRFTSVQSLRPFRDSRPKKWPEANGTGNLIEK